MYLLIRTINIKIMLKIKKNKVLIIKKNIKIKSIKTQQFQMII